LLLVISTSVSHDLIKKTLARGITDKQELRYARVAAALAICVAGYLGINPPGFVAQVVAFAFGLAAASLFPAILLGIFSKTMNKEGAIAGMVVGLGFTFSYIAYFKFVAPEANNAAHWWFGISPEGIGMIGALLNFATAGLVSRFATAAPAHVQQLVENIRIPRGVETPHTH
jgi:cation/acetate symporter